MSGCYSLDLTCLLQVSKIDSKGALLGSCSLLISSNRNEFWLTLQNINNLWSSWLERLKDFCSDGLIQSKSQRHIKITTSYLQIVTWLSHRCVKPGFEYNGLTTVGPVMTMCKSYRCINVCILLGPINMKELNLYPLRLGNYCSVLLDESRHSWSVNVNNPIICDFSCDYSVQGSWYHHRLMARSSAWS